MLSSLRALRELAGRHREEYDIESPPSHRHSCPAAVERPAEASRRTVSRSASFRKRNSQPQPTRSRSPFSRAGSTRSQSRSPFSRTGSRPGSGSSSASLSASANRPGSADLSSGDESDEPNADQLPGLFEAEGLYSFEAESAAELAFSAGQRLRIFPDVPCEPGWWLAELHGRQGLVPCAYVRSRQASRPQTPEALPRTVIPPPSALKTTPAPPNSRNAQQTPCPPNKHRRTTLPPPHHHTSTLPPRSAGGRRIPQGGQGTELPRAPRTRHRRARRRRRQPANLAASHSSARRWWYPPPLTPYPPRLTLSLTPSLTLTPTPKP